MPIIIAVMTAIGLFAGLMGDGLWDWISWVLLGNSVVVLARKVWSRPTSGADG